MPLSNEAQAQIDRYIQLNVRSANDDLEKFNKRLEGRRAALQAGEYAKPSVELCEKFDVVEWKTSGGTPAFTIKPFEIAPSDLEVIYYHGGGFVGDVGAVHWDLCSRLAAALDCPVTVATYRTLPLASYDDMLHESYETYVEVCEKSTAKRIVLMGESSGANLLLSVTQLAMKNGYRLPTFLIMNSPFFEFSASFVEKTEEEIDDLILTWRGNKYILDLFDPNYEFKTAPIDPFYGEIKGLPPMYIINGSREILEAGGREFARRVNEAGGNAVYDCYEGMCHALLLSSGIPECDDAFDRCIKAIKAC